MNTKGRTQLDGGEFSGRTLTGIWKDFGGLERGRVISELRSRNFLQCRGGFEVKMNEPRIFEDAACK